MGIVAPPAEHCGLEVHDASGFESAAAYGEVVEVSMDLDLVVEGQEVLEGKEPGLFDNGSEECVQLALNHADEALVLKFG